MKDETIDSVGGYDADVWGRARDEYLACRRQIAALEKRKKAAAETLRAAAKQGIAPDGVSVSTSARRVIRDAKALVTHLHRTGHWDDALWQAITVDVAKVERLLDGREARLDAFIETVETERLNVR